MYGNKNPEAAQKSLIDCTASFCVACGFSGPTSRSRKNARDECALSDFLFVLLWNVFVARYMSDALPLSAEEINISSSSSAEKNLFLNSRFPLSPTMSSNSDAQ